MRHQELEPTSLACATDTMTAAQVLQVWWHGDDLHGLVEVLDTPAGRLVRGLYCQGFMFGASSRGWSCTVPQQDYSVIADDFQLFA